MISDPTLYAGVKAQEQYLAGLRRIEALAAELRSMGHEPTDEMRIAYRALRAGVMDEAWEAERPLILAAIVASMRPQPAEVGERDIVVRNNRMMG